MSKIDIHADDYALSPNTSEDILQCLRAGKLNSISVLTNMSCYDAYAEKYQKGRQNGPANRFWRYILILWKGIVRLIRKK